MVKNSQNKYFMQSAHDNAKKPESLAKAPFSCMTSLWSSSNIYLYNKEGYIFSFFSPGTMEMVPAPCAGSRLIYLKIGYFSPFSGS